MELARELRWALLLVDCGQNLFLVLDDSGLILLNGFLVGFDVYLIAYDRFLILENAFLVGDDVAF